MRTIKITHRFKRDFRKTKAGWLGNKIDDLLDETLGYIVEDISLPPRFVDHALAGEWKDHRDCYLRPDLVLIYRKPDWETLELVRLGSHSDLSL